MKIDILSKSEVLPTLRFYKEMINHRKHAKTNKIEVIWLLSFIFGILGDIGFFICVSYLFYLMLV